jgi:hypothetical protein
LDTNSTSIAGVNPLPDQKRVQRSRRFRLLRTNAAELAPWFAGIGIALGSNLAANSIGEALELWVKGDKTTFSFLKLSYIVFFVLMVFWFYHVRPILFRPRTRFLRDIEFPEKRKHLVLFLSGLELRRSKYVSGVPEGITLTGDIDKDISAIEVHKKSNPYWQWEMPLRAIRHHLGRLETITLICSPESIQQVSWFREILKKYQRLDSVSVRVLAKDGNLPAIVKVDEISHSFDGLEFERFDELSEAVDRLLTLFKEEDVPEKEIMIDFTGGQKVASVVAAAITFNRKIDAQYVQTNCPWKVVSYDILLKSSDTGEMGI